MSFTGNHICTSFKKEVLTALHNLSASGGHTFKLALYTSDATLNASTEAYTASDEVSGTGYTAGGIELTNVEPTSGNNVGYANFADAVFSNVTLTARGGLIYNSSSGDRAVVVLDFGRDRSKSGADFTVEMPTFDYLNALIRIQ